MFLHCVRFHFQFRDGAIHELQLYQHLYLLFICAPLTLFRNANNIFPGATGRVRKIIFLEDIVGWNKLYIVFVEAMTKKAINVIVGRFLIEKLGVKLKTVHNGRFNG